MLIWLPSNIFDLKRKKHMSFGFTPLIFFIILFLFYRFVRRLRTTLQGSTGDIGWLQRVEGLPPVEDGTARFEEVLRDVRYFTVFSTMD